MSTRHDPDGPEDIDAAFAEIVAGLQRDAPMSSWPAEPGGEPVGGAERPAPPTGENPRDWTPAAEDEGHYEPPEPPPLPKPRPTTVLGVTAIVLGLVLLIISGMTGAGGTVAMPLGLVAISAGIAWLMFRMRQHPPDSGDDNGAQL